MFYDFKPIRTEHVILFYSHKTKNYSIIITLILTFYNIYLKNNNEILNVQNYLYLIFLSLPGLAESCVRRFEISHTL